jgi:hypothetical protein
MDSAIEYFIRNFSSKFIESTSGKAIGIEKKMIFVITQVY